jgi:hypothetical protein
MTRSRLVEGARGNLLVPTTGCAAAKRRRQRGGGPWGKPGFTHAAEPKAEAEE